MDENEHDRLCNNNNNTFYLKRVFKSRTLRHQTHNNNHGLIIHFAKHVKFTHKHTSTHIHLDPNSSKGTMLLLLLYMFRLKQNVIQQNV